MTFLRDKLMNILLFLLALGLVLSLVSAQARERAEGPNTAATITASEQAERYPR
jgi:hypothetical protein